jgi:hypothetical protein
MRGAIRRGWPPLTRRELTAYTIGRRMRTQASPVADFPGPVLADVVSAASTDELDLLGRLDPDRLMDCVWQGWMTRDAH